jgi:hypothetical protein
LLRIIGNFLLHLVLVTVVLIAAFLLVGAGICSVASFTAELMNVSNDFYGLASWYTFVGSLIVGATAWKVIRLCLRGFHELNSRENDSDAANKCQIQVVEKPQSFETSKHDS